MFALSYREFPWRSNGFRLETQIHKFEQTLLLFSKWWSFWRPARNFNMTVFEGNYVCDSIDSRKEHASIWYGMKMSPHFEMLVTN